MEKRLSLFLILASLFLLSGCQEAPEAVSEEIPETEPMVTGVAIELPPEPPAETPLERVERLIAPLEPGDPEKDYLIRVLKDRQMVLVYEGETLQQSFLCCTAIPPHETPSGRTEIGVKYEYGYMIDGSYGQYCSSFYEHFYFHGMPSYGDEKEAGVDWEEFNNLGHPASHGCIRLQSRDAKWIWLYCRPGTPVEILDDSSGIPEVPETPECIKMKEDGPSWDPTNDNPENPYQQNPSLLLP